MHRALFVRRGETGGLCGIDKGLQLRLGLGGIAGWLFLGPIGGFGRIFGFGGLAGLDFAWGRIDLAILREAAALAPGGFRLMPWMLWLPGFDFFFGVIFVGHSLP
ncbi:MAG TPA: hypothetical protein VHY22_00835 [Chthoniobacteraceae bacterium]|nr:hypothetical protein [Chthoniobacteraceae bacterium]